MPEAACRPQQFSLLRHGQPLDNGEPHSSAAGPGLRGPVSRQPSPFAEGGLSDRYLSFHCHAALCIKASADVQRSFAFNFIMAVEELGVSEFH